MLRHLLCFFKKSVSIKEERGVWVGLVSEGGRDMEREGREEGEEEEREGGGEREGAESKSYVRYIKLIVRRAKRKGGCAMFNT